MGGTYTHARVAADEAGGISPEIAQPALFKQPFLTEGEVFELGCLLPQTLTEWRVLEDRYSGRLVDGRQTSMVIFPRLLKFKRLEFVLKFLIALFISCSSVSNIIQIRSLLCRQLLGHG